MYSTGGNAPRQAPAGRIKLEFNAVHSNHLRVTKKDQALVGKCKAALTLSVQKVQITLCGVYMIAPSEAGVGDETPRLQGRQRKSCKFSVCS